MVFFPNQNRFKIIGCFSFVIAPRNNVRIVISNSETFKVVIWYTIVSDTAWIFKPCLIRYAVSEFNDNSTLQKFQPVTLIIVHMIKSIWYIPYHMDHITIWYGPYNLYKLNCKAIWYIAYIFPIISYGRYQHCVIINISYVTCNMTIYMILYGPYHMIHIIWFISNGPYDMLTIFTNFSAFFGLTPSHVTRSTFGFDSCTLNNVSIFSIIEDFIENFPWFLALKWLNWLKSTRFCEILACNAY